VQTHKHIRRFFLFDMFPVLGFSAQSLGKFFSCIMVRVYVCVCVVFVYSAVCSCV